jgi:hypothetical protein
MMDENEERTLEEMVLGRATRLNVVANGIAIGLICGLGLFLATIILVVKGGAEVGPHLWLLSQYLPGYQVTVLGSFVGLAYGLIAGFIVGGLIAYLYNWLVDLRRARSEHNEQA